MQKQLRFCLSTTIAATTLLGACDVGDEPEATTYVFGLSESDLLSLHPMVQDEHTESEWLELHKAPFDCERYGELCSVAGPTAAETIIRDGLVRALAGESREEIDAEIERAVEEAKVAWKASQTDETESISSTEEPIVRQQTKGLESTLSACFIGPNPTYVSRTRTRTRCNSNNAERAAISAAKSAVSSRCNALSYPGLASNQCDGRYWNPTGGKCVSYTYEPTVT